MSHLSARSVLSLSYILLPVSAFVSAGPVPKSYQHLPGRNSDTLYIAPEKSVWKHADYTRHSYRTFIRLPAVNQKIYFKKIDRGLLSAALFYAVNEQRVRWGRKPVQFYTILEKASYAHARYMIHYAHFSHWSRLSGRRTPRDRVARLAVLHRIELCCGENIATTFAVRYRPGTPVYPETLPAHTYLSYARNAVHWWMNSPEHKRNILNKRYTHLGTAAYFYSKKGFAKFMAVQVFSGRLRAAEKIKKALKRTKTKTKTK